MSIHTTVTNHSGQQTTVSFELPDHCPLCGKGIEPKFLTAIWNYDSFRVDAAFRCPRKACQVMFIGVYRDPSHTHTVWKLDYLTPLSVDYPTYPEQVSKVSPRFVEIMMQVTMADAKGLDQLVGMGLRKAIEFLIKDFTIQEHPDQKTTIEEKELAYVIGQCVTDPNIKAVAKRATWLGNDETHYLRKWEKMDITDLKKLVQLTVNWIESHELTKDYRKEMPEPIR